ncbi:MAG: alpha/beta hydrolase [Pseudomonadota bacterium]
MEDNAPPPSPPTLTDGPNGRLAFRVTPGAGPTTVWLGGYASDMLGTKAERLDAFAHAQGKAYLRFDYSGHGESAGAFEDGTISTWFADAEHVITNVAPGPKVLVGSSMGAWITLLFALKHPETVSSIVLIAPAPDFTERLVPSRFTDGQKEALARDGVVRTGTSGHPAETYTQALFDDGRTNLLMDKPIPLPCPVRILHGMSDDVVPTDHVLTLANLIEAPSLTVTLVKGGDHRLSEEADLHRLEATIQELTA